MCSEDTGADEATGPGSQPALQRDVPCATATLTPPQQVPNTGPLVPSMQRDLCCTTEAPSSSTSGCKPACKENRPPASSRKGRLPFSNDSLRHSEAAHVSSAMQSPHVGPHSGSNLPQLPRESLKKGGRHHKKSRFCFTLDFKVVKGEGMKKEEKSEVKSWGKQKQSQA